MNETYSFIDNVNNTKTPNELLQETINNISTNNPYDVD